MNNKQTIPIVSLVAMTALIVTRVVAHAGDAAPSPTGTTSAVFNRSTNYSELPAEPVVAPDTPEIGLAAFKGDVSSVRRLISSGASTESAGKDQRTPLLLASARGHIEVVSALLAAGANINARDTAGATALHWAAEIGDERIAFLLLSHRPEVNVQDEIGETPLIWAAMIGDKAIVEALLAAGANPNLADVSGRTASVWAKRNKHLDIVSLLDRSH